MRLPIAAIVAMPCAHWWESKPTSGCKRRRLRIPKRYNWPGLHPFASSSEPWTRLEQAKASCDGKIIEVRIGDAFIAPPGYTVKHVLTDQHQDDGEDECALAPNI
jgi:hypothetical protein